MTTAIIIVVAVIVLIAIIFAAMYNGLIKSRNQVEEAFSTMDVFLKKRYDLIPNLVATVKGAAAHESDVLSQVTANRTAAMAASSANLNDKIEKETALDRSLSRLFAVAEAYPDLKANAAFTQLQSQLEGVEDDISNARKYYNGCVRTLNTKVESFPSNIVANMNHIVKAVYYELDDPAERKNVSVSFN